MKTSTIDTLADDYIVIDTEGKPVLRELAIVNSRGETICELHVDRESEVGHPNLHLQTLPDVLHQFARHSHNKVVVCHHVEHDRQVLRDSFTHAHIPWVEPQWACSCELARKELSDVHSYGLENLAHALNLQVNGQYFNGDRAHSALYDAEFTYQLYRLLRRRQNIRALKDRPNPFTSSRVDTPFQTHPNLDRVSQTEFERLKAVIRDVERDVNHQSQGVVVQGEPGSGKTHIIMRLADDLLDDHRLLFIRQPNNAESILYHTYSRILESLAESVGERTQLDLLLTRSLAPIVRAVVTGTEAQSDRVILEALASDRLDLLGAEGSRKQREYWDRIEKHAQRWWNETYSNSGYAPAILKGLMRYCRYTQLHLKNAVTRWLSGSELNGEELSSVGLESWPDRMSREAFALEAIAVLGKLSLLDRPLILVFDQLEALGMAEHRPILMAFGEAVKELFTHVPNCVIILNLFPDRWTQFQQLFDGSIVDRVSQTQIVLQKPPLSVMQDMISMRLEALPASTEDIFEPEELQDILEQSSIRKVINRASDYYRYRICNVPLPPQSEPALKVSTEDTISSAEVLRRLRHLEERVWSLRATLDHHGLSHDGQPAIPAGVEANSPALAPTIVSPSSSQQIVHAYLEDQRELLARQYEKPTICDDSDDIGKLRAIALAMSEIKSFQTQRLSLGKRKLPEHLVIQSSRTRVMGFLNTESSRSFLARLQNFNQLVLYHPHMRFGLFRDSRQRIMTGKVTQTAIERLKNAENGSFNILAKKERIELELINKMITDIRNRDLDVDLPDAMRAIAVWKGRTWLTKLFD
ncbi:MAG: 3'-5' exonuclease [Cyanobacteria bacterium J06642_2]